MNRNRLLERFLQYVKIDTTAREDASEYPSSPGQLELGRLILSQLHEMGLKNATQDRHGIVLATVPGNCDGPAIVFNAHLDTSPETTGANVKPRVIENWSGDDITLTGDTTKVITREQCPELAGLVGKTLITTDGTTLLGGDDKAGLAIIMELAHTLMENPQIRRGPVRVLFTCDEEIGRGTRHVDVKSLNAVAGYTFDGGSQNHIDLETFSADLATVTFTGINIHPSIALGKMVNSIKAAGEFIQQMPRDLAPEQTEGRDGFLHPYTIEGGVAKTVVKILLRSFDTAELATFANQLRELATRLMASRTGCRIDVAVTEQYRNLGDGLRKDPRAGDIAIQAHERLGRTPVRGIIRGGTDGSQFTEKGLPTPNLSSGQHNIHSPLEFACLDEMCAACDIGLEIVKLWAE
jgi:tripeptide aminopeptidase